MNRFENWFCGSTLWQNITRRQILPWIAAGSDLGEHIIEIGAGHGAATGELQQRTPRVTALEYDAHFAAGIAAREKNSRIAVVRGDAAALPFANGTFSSAIAILVLHHLRTIALQDQAFHEIYRVLRPGGIFLAFEIHDSWFHRVGHFKSTFVPVVPSSAFTRLTEAGFSRVILDFHRGGFGIRALRAKEH